MGYLKSVQNTSTDFSKVKTDLFAIGVFEDLKLSAIGKEADKYLDKQISSSITNANLEKLIRGLATFMIRSKIRFLQARPKHPKPS